MEEIMIVFGLSLTGLGGLLAGVSGGLEGVIATILIVSGAAIAYSYRDKLERKIGTL